MIKKVLHVAQSRNMNSLILFYVQNVHDDSVNENHDKLGTKFNTFTVNVASIIFKFSKILNNFDPPKKEFI